MIKLMIFGVAFFGLCEGAITNLQLVLADDAYNVLSSGKSSTSTLDNAIPTFSNAILEEDKLSKVLPEELKESTASSHLNSQDPSQSPAAAAAANAADDPDAPSAVKGEVPAAITRVKPASALNGITSSSGVSRGSLLITSSAQASANSPVSNSPVTSLKSTSTIQHRILPPETIPLPITISTRHGLRTVIAPETITLQQPGIAKLTFVALISLAASASISTPLLAELEPQPALAPANTKHATYVDAITPIFKSAPLLASASYIPSTLTTVHHLPYAYASNYLTYASPAEVSHYHVAY